MNRRLLIAIAGAAAMLAVSRVIERWLGDSAVPLASAGAIVQFIAAGCVAAAVLVWLASRASVDRSRTLRTLFAIGCIIIVVNNVEALVFRIGPARAIAWLAALSIGFHALVVSFIGYVLPLRSSADEAAAERVNRSPTFWLGRLAALGVAYGVIYFVAGAIIYPFVRDFYATTRLPDRGTVFALQILGRGPAFVGVGVLVVLLIRGSRRMNAAAVAVTLAGVGGVAALIAPNALLPDHVRAVHLAEVGISNAVFGGIVGWVMSAAIAARPERVGRTQSSDTYSRGATGRLPSSR